MSVRPAKPVSAAFVNKSRRDAIAAALMQTFLDHDAPSTFSETHWRNAVLIAARRAVQAADILLGVLDGNFGPDEDKP